MHQISQKCEYQKNLLMDPWDFAVFVFQHLVLRIYWSRGGPYFQNSKATWGLLGHYPNVSKKHWNWNLDVKIGCAWSQNISLNFSALCIAMYRSSIGVLLPETPFEGSREVENWAIWRKSMFEGFRVYYPKNRQFGLFQLSKRWDWCTQSIAKLLFPPKLSLK